MVRRKVVVAAILAAFGCEGNAELLKAPEPDAAVAAAADAAAALEDGLADAASSPDAAELPAPDAGLVMPACPAPGLLPGDHQFELEHDGRTRVFDLHVPPGYDPNNPTPLVLYFHPLLTGKEYLQRADTPLKADAENYLAAYADGVRNSWNGGACCGPANGIGIAAEEIDDVGFVRAMVAHIEGTACVDRRRIYAAGF